MQLTSFTFLFAFLPAVLVCAMLARRSIRARNGVLLAGSLLFCAAGGLPGLFAGVLETLAVFGLGKRLSKAEGEKAKKRVLILGVILSAGLLCYFKYTNFLFRTLRLPEAGILPAPVGVSFLTFLLISYLIDVYRGKIPAETRFARFLLFALFFPKAAQGPLCRYEDFSSQLENRADDAMLSDGASRVILGLGKKALLSSAAGELAAQAFALPADALTPVYAWAGMLLYALQIYFDFAGYTDMAIGLALLFGIRLPENFDSPYLAVSVTDFWRRWHKSLSSWFRDYVYIPLGGSRCGKARQVLNLFVVWSLTGLWHGADWTFLCWGLWFFLLLTLEKLWLGKVLSKLPRLFGHLYALAAVLIGWVFFNSRSLSYAISFLRALFVPGTGAPDGGAWLLLGLRQHGVFLAVALILCTNFGKTCWQTLGRTKTGQLLRYAFLLLTLGLSILHLTGSGMQAFIYAQF